VPASRDLACFYRSLGELLSAGVLASEALRTAAAFLPAAEPAVARVAAGEPLSAALARLPGVVPSEHLHFLRLGERSGSLDRVLGDLAEVAERWDAARVQVRNGLLLPGIMVHLAALVSPLPQLLLRGDIAGYLGAALGLVALFWGTLGGIRLLARHAGPDLLDRLARGVGLVRPAWEQAELWRIASALRLCARTSLGWPEALVFVAGLCRSPALRQTLLTAAEAAGRRGIPPSQVIRASGAWPAEFVAFWETGERTGSLDAVFARLAERHADGFRDEFTRLAQRLPWFAYGAACALVVVQILKHGLSPLPVF
jgi:type II secretory pathway component PulF